MHFPDMTLLGTWMKASGKDDRWLADRIGCSRPQACRIRNGTSRPSANGAFQIEKLTRGKVKALDLLSAPTLQPANDAAPQSEAA